MQGKRYAIDSAMITAKAEMRLKKRRENPSLQKDTPQSRVSPVITCTPSTGGLPPVRFIASNIQPQTAVGRPANHGLIRHPL